jgi:4-hydroxy-tetrahydrodipicolinate synthase
MTTPFREDETIDEAALRAEARYLIETARVHGLAVAGSTGEGHTLTTDEVRGITGAVVEEARGRVPAITGIITETYLSPRLLARIIESVPGVIGVKQSSGDMKLLADLLLGGERACVMTAVDALLYPSFTLGAHGAPATSPAQADGIRRALQGAGVLR